MDRQQLIHKAQAQARALLDLAKRGPVKLLLIIGGGIVALAVLALIAINVLISADAVRDRVAQRIKEQTGRELTVNGTTALLFTPGPHIVITDAAFTDPEARAGTADISIARLVLDLSFSDLLSRQVDAERVLVERPVVTVRLGSAEQPVDVEIPGFAYSSTMDNTVVCALPLRPGYAVVLPFWDGDHLEMDTVRVRALGSTSAGPWVVQLVEPYATETLWIDRASRRLLRHVYVNPRTGSREHVEWSVR